MVGNEFFVEELLCNDATKIIIDEEAKKDLKNRLINGDKHNATTDIPKHKNKFKENKYLKIASGFIICVFVSGTILKVMDVQSNKILSNSELKSDFVMSLETEVPSEGSDDELRLSQAKEGTSINTSGTNQPQDTKGVSVIDSNKSSVGDNTKTNNNSKDSLPSDEEINSGLTKPNKNTAVSTDVKRPINVPKMENLNPEEILKTYDSRYSADGKRLVNVKSGGIYIKNAEASKEQKILAYDDKANIINKPNFMPNDDIIYYKAEKVSLENSASGEKNGAIYLCDKNGENSTKVVDGKNPMISKDGKKLVYEAEGKICVLTLATNNKSVVDIGKYPAWSDNGNLISYVKEDIEKRFSSVWIFDLATKSTRSLTNNDTNINKDNIESWAGAVRSANVTSDFNVATEYSYFESIWSSNNKEIYVIRSNNKSQSFDLIKFSVDN